MSVNEVAGGWVSDLAYAVGTSLAFWAKPIERNRDAHARRQLRDKPETPRRNLDDALVPRLATTPRVAGLARIDDEAVHGSIVSGRGTKER